MFHSFLDFVENERDSRKLQKVQELVNNLVSNVSIDENLINYEEEKMKKKSCVYKSKTNIYKHLVFVVNAVRPCLACRAKLGKIPYKVYVLVMCLSMISRTTSSFVFLFFISPLSSTRPKF